MGKKNKRHAMCGTQCDNCNYIGDGDFICELHIEDPDKALVIEDWQPTDNYMQCRKRGNNAI